MTAYVRIGTGEGPRYARVDALGLRLLDRAPWLGGQETGTLVLEAERLVPVEPSKIVCIGRNYRAHAKEMGNDLPKEPLLFFKPPSSLTVGAIELPNFSERVDFEAELGVVIGKRLRHATEAEAAAAIFGLICVNDVSARDLQKKDNQWARAKGCDTFCPVGTEVVTGVDWRALDITCTHNGVVRQSGNTRDMIFSVAYALAYMSAAMTLQPGDLISTGTPDGVAQLRPGDVCEIAIGGVGRLISAVVAVPTISG